jgi:hypothetical protein
MAEPPPPSSERERSARADLAVALEREILGAAGGPDAGARRSRKVAPRRRWFELLQGPALRPALAAVALTLIVLGGYEIASRPGREQPSGVVRGGPAGAAAAMRLTEGARPGGATILQWTRMPAADAYEIVVYGAALTEIARLPAGADSALALAPGTLPAAAARESALVCRVIAMRGGDEIGRSNLLPLARVP